MDIDKAEELMDQIAKQRDDLYILLVNTEKERDEALAKLAVMESQKSIATLRVTHKGYSVSLANYVAYSLPEGDHFVYTKPVSVDKPAVAVPNDWREAVQEFVDRCKRGEINSRYTYGKFKALLESSPSHIQQSAPRITERDAREIIEHFCNWTKIKSPCAASKSWLEDLGGRELLAKLNDEKADSSGSQQSADKAHEWDGKGVCRKCGVAIFGRRDACLSHESEEDKNINHNQTK